MDTSPAGDGKSLAPDVAAQVARFKWVILFALVLSAIVEVLPTTIVNVAMPTMAGNLGCTTDEVAWVSTAYILANVIVLPMTAWLAERIGAKRYLIVSLAGFLVTSVLCGLSHSLGEIIVWRLLQGAAGAPCLSLTQALILEVFPKREHNMAQSVWGLGIIVAPTVGPAFGGWLTDTYSWPWIFFINVPIALLAIVLLVGFLPALRPPKRSGAVDYLGILLLAAGLGSIQYVLEEGNRNDWFGSVLITRLTLLGLVSSVLFVMWQLHPRNRFPVVNLRILRDPAVAAGVALNTVIGYGLYVGLFLYPIFAQLVMGFTSLKTGLTLLPSGAATAVGIVITFALMAKGIQARTMVAAGVAVLILSQWILGHLSFQSNEVDTGWGLLWRGLGLGLVALPVTAAAVAGLRGPHIAEGSSLASLGRQLGGSFGIAIASTHVTRMMTFHRSNLVAHLYAGNPTLMGRAQGVTSWFVVHGYSPPTALWASARVLDLSVQAQSYTMAVNDAFLLVLVVFTVSLPLVLLLRKTDSGSVAVAGH